MFLSASVLTALAGWHWFEGSLTPVLIYAGLCVLSLAGWALATARRSGRKEVLTLTALLVATHVVMFGLIRLWLQTPPAALEGAVLAERVLYYFGSASVVVLLACLTVPRSRREVLLVSVLPAGLMLAGAWWVLREEIAAGQVVTSVGMSVGLLIAGLLCFEVARHALVHRLFCNRQDDPMQSELLNAKRVHESLFPEPIAGDAFRFGYAYRPMRQIGGDFVHIHHATSGAFYLTVVDVTGHGITSALTVNRLHAELQQYFAKTAGPCPSVALGYLNEYVRLTMAEHGMFATGMCVRLDPTESKMTVANAGHPLCYVRNVDGLRQVHADGAMLGVFEGEAFDSTPVSFSFSPGDQLVMVTDGAIEAKSPANEMLGTDRLHRIIERSCAQSASNGSETGGASLLQKKMSGRLIDRADVRKPVGLIQQVLRQRMNLHPCALADEIMLSIDDFVRQDYQDDVLIATIELLKTCARSDSV